jgi:putative ABC transport system permease protein
MLKNYFKVALRSLIRHRFFSFINIFGLAISMSVCLGIMMLVADQLSYDHYNTKHDRIFRVITQYYNSDGSPSGPDASTCPLPMSEALRDNYTGVEKTVRIRRGFGNSWMELEDQDVNIPVGGFFVDPTALDVFEYELEYGNPKTALVEPYSVVLTHKTAKKLFKMDNPVGESIKVGKLGTYKVTGVIKDKDQKSHIVFEALASFATIESLEADGTFKAQDQSWGDWTTGWVYLLLEGGKTKHDIEVHLADVAKKHQPDKYSAQDKHQYKFYLQNILAITPGPLINNPIGPFMPMIFVYFFGGLALIVMLTSCFNYTNLSIARSLTRAREIGVRKVSGANRTQIFMQFLSESVIISIFSLGLSLLFLMLLKPFMLNLKFAQVLKWDLAGNVYVYIAFFVFSIMVGVLAGLFPAAILSRFQPINVLKNVGGMKLFSRLGLRKSLLVGQFALSLIFIISVLLLFNQLKLFIKADHGFDMSNTINVKLNSTSYQALQTELMRHSNIQNTSAASHIPAAGMTYGDGFKRNLNDQEGYGMSYFYVDNNYLDNLNIQLVAGRNFNAELANKQNILVNEKAVKTFHFDTPQDAIGQSIYMEKDSAQFQIIGVVRDYNHQVMMSQIDPMALRYDPEQFHLMHVKYSGNHEDAVKSIEAAWTKVNPSLKLDHVDFEEEVRSFYKTMFSDFVNIIAVMAFMAITISCLGLLGMATYTTETRLKEISIRKVLGSTDGALVFLLSKSFFKLLLIAITIALPVAWFINNLWLELIAYHTTFNFTVIISGVSILLVLGAVTIGSQTLRAAYTNPVDNLKNE